MSSPSTPSLPRAVGSSPRGSLLGVKVSGHTPTAPFVEPAVSGHGVVSVADQGFSSSLSLPEATTSSAALVPLQLTPLQQPPQAHGSPARSVAASNGKIRTMPTSAVSSGEASRRSSISSSIADRPAWSPCFSRSSALHTCSAEDRTPHSRRLTTASLQRTACSTPSSPSPARAVVDSPAVEPSSVQAIRRTGSNAPAACLMSTSKNRGSAKTAAQPSAVRPIPAQSRAGRAAVQGTIRATRAGQSKTGPAAPVPAVQRPATIRTTGRNRAAASTSAGQSVAKNRGAASGRPGEVQSKAGPTPVEPKQARTGQDRTVQKEAATRTQPARRVNNPGHTWKC